MRLQILGYPYHVISRGNNKSKLFQDDSDFLKFLYLIGAARKKFGLLIYNYVLMTNHIHLLVEQRTAETLAPAMELIFKTFAHYINEKYDRSGHVFESRYKNYIIQTDLYFLSCCRYINLNPVRANMVKKPEFYTWSSYSDLAFGKKLAIPIDRHRLYHNLGNTEEERHSAYRSIVKFQKDDYEKRIENSRTIIGDKAFKTEIKALLQKTI